MSEPLNEKRVIENEQLRRESLRRDINIVGHHLVHHHHKDFTEDQVNAINSQITKLLQFLASTLPEDEAGELLNKFI